MGIVTKENSLLRLVTQYEYSIGLLVVHDFSFGMETKMCYIE